jgi:CelD/BcsL family acetyltransferase involved in cellulose biosynthesis
MSIALPLQRNRLGYAAADDGRTARIAAVELHREFATAEPVWRRLESEDAVATPYQKYDFLAAWQRHVGFRQSMQPLIAAAYDSGGRPLLLWPLGCRARGPFRVAEFLGGKHANTNFGLWNRDFLAGVAPADLRFVIERIAADGGGIDLMALHRQPASWSGFANPLLSLPHQASASDCCHRRLHRTGQGGPDAEITRAMRKRLRNKGRKLAELPGFRYFQATQAAEVDQLLDWFFCVKARHLAGQGLANAFAEPGVEDFVRDTCHCGLGDGNTLTELHAIEGDGEVLALFGGTGDGQRFSLMFNTYTHSAHARHSPGLVLLNYMVSVLGDRGFTSLDLGAGDSFYKRGICRETDALSDSFLPLTPQGHVAAACARLAMALKREVKRTPHIWSALQFVRRHASMRR